MITKLGDKGYAVSVLQRSLTQLGYFKDAIDGNYSNNTVGAVKAFQQAKNLQADGVCGPLTWAALNYLVPQGIDVSHHDGSINFNLIPDCVSFVFIKCTEGVSYEDPMYDRNVAGFKGKIRAAYHYLKPGSIDQQVKNVLGHNIKLELPLVVDVEEPGVTAPMVLQFCQAIQQQTGISPIIYTYKSFLTWTKDFAKYKLWIASYQNLQPGLPAPWQRYAFWQWSQYLYCPGCQQNDQNLFNGTMDDLKALCIS